MFFIRTLLLLPMFFLMACKAVHKEESLTDDSLSARFENAKSVIKTHCLDCHSPSGSASSTLLNLSTQTQFITAGLVVPGDPDNSPLIYRTQYYPNSSIAPANMPLHSSSFTQSDFKKLYDWVNQMNQDNISTRPFSCNSEEEVSVSPLRRLSKSEYQNTLYDLLSDLENNRDTVWANLNSSFQLLPNDGATSGFKKEDNRITEAHITSYYNIGSILVEQILSNSTYANSFIGSCHQSPNEVCIKNFISSFGLRTYRRPLSSDEVDTIYTRYYQSSTHNLGGFADVILQFLLSSKFLYHFETEGTEIAHQLLQISDYELASRLSYLYWRTMPDSSLLSMAASGSLNTAQGLNTALSHIKNHSRYRETVRDFYRQWLQVDYLPRTVPTNSVLFDAFLAGDNITNNSGHIDAMFEEIEILTEYYTFLPNGKLSDLYGSNISLTQSTELAGLYNIDPYVPNQPAPRFPANERAGLFTRAAFLITGNEKNNPIHRGAYIRKRVLCDSIPEPNPAELPDGALDEPVPDPNLTTRERFHNKTNAASCQGCHSQINPIGFSFSMYDSIGRYRQTENIFDSSGNLLTSISVDSYSVPLIDATDTRPTSSAIELSNRLGESTKAKACFVKQFFHYGKGRKADNNIDGCMLDPLLSTLDADGIGAMFESFSQLRGFRLRKIED